ncbi:glycosyltransferase [Clostridium sp. NSJ-145]|uniref:glycosyltransferase n=1 Tax=Clostridium sp. NSJ-145 TaxID=2897777 RepID=UPI001E41E733|nr:glycosyltransferase [Clostridium sp. NSJ-145]MCD2502896.1 glycosyltransferase [Clostridium sp. NSJ-145]
MKKVLFVLSYMNIGGVEKSLLSLLATFPKDKYDVTILLLNKKGGFLEYLPSWVKVEEADWFKYVNNIIMQPPQITVKNYIKENRFFTATRFIKDYFFSKYMENRYIYYKNVLKDIPECKEEYDIAVSYAGPTEIIDAYVVKKVKAKKKVAWVHFDVSKHFINKKLYENLYKDYDKIFVVSNEAKQQLLNKISGIERKTEVFLNIISENLIKEMAEAEQEVKYDSSFINIVTVGRLSKEKGQDLAIETLNLLKKDGYKVRWYCVGDGNSRKEYENLIKKYELEEDFILLGAKPNPYPYIKNADIYVQTSRHEGYCLTLAEAKCLNKPIITTNFIGAYEQIKNESNGFIVNADVNNIFDKVKELIFNKQLRDYLTKNLSKQNIDTISESNKLLNLINKE